MLLQSETCHWGVFKQPTARRPYSTEKNQQFAVDQNIKTIEQTLPFTSCNTTIVKLILLNNMRCLCLDCLFLNPLTIINIKTLGSVNMLIPTTVLRVSTAAVRTTGLGDRQMHR